jgi:hypothetical protein
MAHGHRGVASKETKMKAALTKFAAVLALSGAFALGTATFATTGAAQAQQHCDQRYDNSGAPVGPYC